MAAVLDYAVDRRNIAFVKSKVAAETGLLPPSDTTVHKVIGMAYYLSGASKAYMGSEGLLDPLRMLPVDHPRRMQRELARINKYAVEQLVTESQTHHRYEKKYNDDLVTPWGQRLLDQPSYDISNRLRYQMEGTMRRV